MRARKYGNEAREVYLNEAGEVYGNEARGMRPGEYMGMRLGKYMGMRLVHPLTCINPVTLLITVYSPEPSP